MRLSREEINIKICQIVALRSQCERAQVGCVITTTDHRIISTGYNNPISKYHDCLVTCKLHDTCYHTLHAEANAIVAAAKHGIELNGTILYCTYSPCFNCAQLIVQAGIFKVIFEREYRIKDGILLLKENGIQVIKYEQEPIKDSQKQEGPKPSY